MVVKAATGDISFKWDRGQNLTNKLDLQAGTSDDSALLTWDVTESGTYTTEYYLKDYSKVYATIKKIDDDSLDFYYQVYSYIDTGTDGIPDTWSNITDTVTGDYQFVDYKSTPVNFLLEDGSPDVVDVDLHGTGDEKAIRFENITKGNLYPGATFKMNGNIVRFMWEDANFYFQTTGIQAGQVTPFILNYKALDPTTKGPYILEILTKIDEFEATPSHYYDNSGTNKNIFKEGDPAAHGVKPGDHPGFDLSFVQPKVWDYTDQKYVDDGTLFADNDVNANIHLREYGDATKSTVQNIKLDKSGTNDFYKSGKYDARFVKNDTTGWDGNYVQWDALLPSTMYEVEAYLRVGDDVDNKFDRTVPYKGGTTSQVLLNTYIPNGGYAYTYLDYVLKRESIDEAYLEVTPYKGIEDDVIKYDVYVSPEKAHLKDGEENSAERWLTYTHEIGSDTYGGKLFIPVKFTGNPGYYYKIKIYFDGQETDRKLYTQLLHYQSKDGELVPPPISTIKSISDIKVLPSESGSITDEPSKITADITWEAPEEDMLNKLLDHGDLFYELLINEEPLHEDSGTKSFETIKLFKVTRDPGTNEIIVSVEKGFDGSALDSTYYKKGYNADNNTFRINDFVIKSKDPAEGWMNIYEIDYKDIIEGEPKDLSDAVSEKMSGTDKVEYGGVKKLPNVNFLRMRTIYLRDTDGDVSDYEDGAYSNFSIAKGMSLSNTAIDIPIVKDFKHENIMTGTDQIKFDITWDVVDVSTYESYMLGSIDKYLKNDDVYYEVYLTQDKSQLTHLDLVDESTGAFDFTVAPVDSTPATIDFSDPANLDKLNSLRDGEVISIKVQGYKDATGEAKLAVLGADQNQVYHATVVTRIDVRDEATDAIDESRRGSKSEIISFTTLNLEGPIEVMPLVPENFAVIEVISSSAIKLGWVSKLNELSPSESIGYEVVRVEGRTLDEGFSATTTQEAIIESAGDKKDIVGWRILEPEKNDKFIMQVYDSENDVWNTVDDKMAVALNNFNMIDDTLNPNQVYYYYLRAIRVNKTADGSISIDRNKPASEWTAITYTSDPLKAPINLTQVYDVDYDEYREAVVYFDVAIPESGADAFVPELHIFSEDDDRYDETYVLMNSDTTIDQPVNLEAIDSTDSEFKDIFNKAPSGYKRYVYRLIDLKPGKNYSLKARVRTKVAPGKESNVSSFSNRIVIRTEFDGDEYDKEQQLNYYLEYYKLKTDELYKTMYWVGLDKDKNQLYKFRQYPAVDELSALPEKKYELNIGDDDEVSIYLPNALIDVLENQDVSLIIKHNNVDFTIQPDTFRKAKIDAYKDINSMIKQRSALKDYYLKLTFKFRDHSGKINGQNPISDLMRIEAELVASSKTELELESLILDRLESNINTYRNKVKNALINALKLNNSVDTADGNEEILIVVDDIIEDLKDSQEAYVGQQMHNVVSGQHGYEASMYTFFEPIIAAIHSDGNSAMALYKRENGKWNKEIAKKSSLGVRADIKTVGEYIFAGYANEDLIQPDTKNAKLMNDIIGKYNLMEFITIIELSDMSQDVSKYNVYYMLARILGAPTDANAIEWLKDEGFEGISKKRLYSGMRNDEAYDLLVQGYGYKNNMDLKSVRITNRNAIKDLNEARPSYQDNLMIGSQLNLLNLVNNQLNPDESLSMEDYLNALVIIEYKKW